MTTDHPQHSANFGPHGFAREVTLSLLQLQHAHIGRGINLAPLGPKELLAANAATPFTVKPAPMPQHTGRAA